MWASARCFVHIQIGSQIPVYLTDIFISKKLKEIKGTVILDLILTIKRLVSEIEVEGDVSFYSISIFECLLCAKHLEDCAMSS